MGVLLRCAGAGRGQRRAVRMVLRLPPARIVWPAALPVALLLRPRHLGAAQADVGVIIDEVTQAVPQVRGHGHGKRQLALSNVVVPASADPHLGNLQEAAPGALLHVQVETLLLDVYALRGQLLDLYALYAGVKVLLRIHAPGSRVRRHPPPVPLHPSAVAISH